MTEPTQRFEPRIRLPDLKLEAQLGEIALNVSQMRRQAEREVGLYYAMALIGIHYDPNDGQRKLYDDALDYYKQRVEWFSLQ